MSLKVQAIAKRLSPRFPAANYGLAGGIKASRIKLQGSSLFIVAPPYLCDSQKALPTFFCGSASRLAHRSAFKSDLDSSMLKMAFPVMISPGFETFSHGMGFAVEEGEGYLIGLTPFDKALGIRGITRYNEFWHQFKVSESQELELMAADRVVEACGWDLLGEHESFVPIAVRHYKENRLGMISLQLNIKNGFFFFNTTLRIVIFSESSSAFIGEWACDLSIALPLDRLGAAVRTIQELGKEPDLFGALMGCRYSDYFEPDFDLKRSELKKPAVALYNRALPALINIAERIPRAEVAGVCLA